MIHVTSSGESAVIDTYTIDTLFSLSSQQQPLKTMHGSIVYCFETFVVLTVASLPFHRQFELDMWKGGANLQEHIEKRCN